MTKLTEYKVLTGNSVYCEHKLNEWKEMYDLTILKMSTYGSSGVAILLLRTISQPDKEKES